MKRKILHIVLIEIILCVTIFTLSGCGKENEVKTEDMQEQSQKIADTKQEIDLKDIYLEVLNNKREYVNEDNQKLKIESYSNLKNYKNETNITYAILDIDEDGLYELVALFNEDYYMIFNYEDETVYGFEEVYRGLKNLRTNGHYIASSGAGYNEVCKTSFNKNKRDITILAQIDYPSYTIANKKATEEEYNNYLKEQFYSVDEVKWIKFDTSKITLSENKDTKTTQKNTEDLKNGIYTYTYPNLGMEVDGSKEIITLKDGNITFERKYFDMTKKGTYTVNGNNIVANYTDSSVFSQGEQKMVSEKISETVTYNITTNGLQINEMDINKTFTKSN